MFESLMTFSSSEPITIGNALIAILISMVSGLIISMTYMKTSENKKFSQNFAVTTILLPAIISAIIMLIGSDIAKAFSLAGAFSIIRFRSTPGEPKDIAFVLFALAAGLACGVGLYGFALILTLLLCMVMLVLSMTKYGKNDITTTQLVITIPEDMEFEEVFDEILCKNSSSYKMTKLKTSAMGSLFQVTYEIDLLENTDKKKLIDELRLYNGNLNIQINMINAEVTC